MKSQNSWVSSNIYPTCSYQLHKLKINNDNHLKLYYAFPFTKFLCTIISSLLGYKIGIYSHITDQENWGTKKLNNLTKFTQSKELEIRGLLNYHQHFYLC